MKDNKKINLSLFLFASNDDQRAYYNSPQATHDTVVTITTGLSLIPGPLGSLGLFSGGIYSVYSEDGMGFASAASGLAARRFPVGPLSHHLKSTSLITGTYSITDTINNR